MINFPLTVDLSLKIGYNIREKTTIFWKLSETGERNERV